MKIIKEIISLVLDPFSTLSSKQIPDRAHGVLAKNKILQIVLAVIFTVMILLVVK